MIAVADLRLLMLFQFDASAWVERRENAVREEWVKSMELRITREALGKCQKLEGVNHYEKCKDLAVRYTNMLRGAQVSCVV